MFSNPSLICSDELNNGFTISISYNRILYSFGEDDNGALGHKKTNLSFPKQISNLTDIKMVSCGVKHTVCLNYTGFVYSFGSNLEGQLGIENLQQTQNPQQLHLPQVKQISCGYYFTLCISEEGFVYICGDNSKGQLGLGKDHHSQITSPTQIFSLSNVEYGTCGREHSICRTYSNQYYVWGNNVHNQLGLEDYTEQYECFEPLLCNNFPEDIIDIKCGEHSLLLTSEGIVYYFGEYASDITNNEQLENKYSKNIIQDIPEIQKIGCGDNHSLLIDINNNLWVFGSNSYGQLGLDNDEYVYKPILHPTLSNIIDLSFGGDHTFVKTIDNKIYSFGKNENSQIGIETSKEEQYTPLQVFKDIEDIWCSFIGKSRQKSARK